MNVRRVLLLLAAAVATCAHASIVHRNVHRRLAQDGVANIVVLMKHPATRALDQVDLDFDDDASRGEHIERVVNHLEDVATQSQRAIDRFLAQEADLEATYEKQYKSWTKNARYFRGASPRLVEALAKLPGVAEIREELVLTIEPPSIESVQEKATSDSVEWGVDRVGAPHVWADGITGKGVVVGGIDTGVRATHEALRSNFRSNYSWFDPLLLTEEPYDQNGHGTHTMGTIAGANGVGVAPGVEWIACLGCPLGGLCYEYTLVRCGEWMLCPTDPSGKNRDCSKAPHIINNSWGGPGGRTYYQEVVDAWQAVGIIPVFAMGNAGPVCGSVNSPGDFANVISVGSTAKNETLATTSSRGPSLSGLTKPEIAAPGRLVRSTWNTSDTSYNTISGTSMATPHVVGSIALLLSSEPELKFDAIRNRLISTTDQHGLTVDFPNNISCGNKSFNSEWPNNHFGYGRLNVFSAYKGSRPSTEAVPSFL